MDEIQHRYESVNDGLKLQVMVLFCHGFPEIWYTWRHQMVGRVKAGYGLSDQTPEPDKATFLDFISDILALVDFLNISKLHVAEIGDGPSVVLFCHGFPEIWYTWRHQMVAMAKAGYRAIASDYRGINHQNLKRQDSFP
ncbi:hypothetical protein M9H77_25827 [Catharanthus roseus]|uniref:Uncharacterized protein n=1 Tax=Catharanthus roseus TaxID=4058 RepID=A0ACC0A8T7_CATRO|nr:hypothetical protein M9H77_25827 [Catharanthus roseus]